jgi:hypothetical protein
MARAHKWTCWKSVFGKRMRINRLWGMGQMLGYGEASGETPRYSLRRSVGDPNRFLPTGFTHRLVAVNHLPDELALLPVGAGEEAAFESGQDHIP